MKYNLRPRKSKESKLKFELSQSSSFEQIADIEWLNQDEEQQLLDILLTLSDTNDLITINRDLNALSSSDEHLDYFARLSAKQLEILAQNIIAEKNFKSAATMDITLKELIILSRHYNEGRGQLAQALKTTRSSIYNILPRLGFSYQDLITFNINFRQSFRELQQQFNTTSVSYLNIPIQLLIPRQNLDVKANFPYLIELVALENNLIDIAKSFKISSQFLSQTYDTFALAIQEYFPKLFISSSDKIKSYKDMQTVCRKIYFSTELHSKFPDFICENKITDDIKQNIKRARTTQNDDVNNCTTDQCGFVNNDFLCELDEYSIKNFSFFSNEESFKIDEKYFEREDEKLLYFSSK